jgi:hypothetical protein
MAAEGGVVMKLMAMGFAAGVFACLIVILAVSDSMVRKYERRCAEQHNVFACEIHREWRPIREAAQ